eukprot:12275011-Ditylum_brightwellii.AAC.1
MNNTSPSTSNEAVEENNIQDTSINTSTNSITMTNNTTTDNAFNKSGTSQDDNEDNPRNK